MNCPYLIPQSALHGTPSVWVSLGDQCGDSSSLSDSLENTLKCSGTVLEELMMIHTVRLVSNNMDVIVDRRHGET